jgi:hypothetical protein
MAGRMLSQTLLRPLMTEQRAGGPAAALPIRRISTCQRRDCRVEWVVEAGSDVVATLTCQVQA